MIVKKIIKWKDIQNSKEKVRQDLEVSLNDVKYRLSYFPGDIPVLLTDDTDFYLYIDNEKFFDSLKLKVIEER